ncbi:translational GTPase TypA [Poriferisphaera sp. WC338]|uniref:translational GTPase TypA n=1 Tax=Poriferisphaera sp. WC338 TaxID=3425129 RepID=UPI003D81A908
MDQKLIRNVAVIAHVDHGKTTLTDQMLYQSGMFRTEDLNKLAGGQHNLIMDTGDLERERGITITSKNCSVRYESLAGDEYKINLIDTPGHADFGGEVERVLKMADGVLLVVDSFEGPMPQTRFVLEKALGHGLKPVVVINKIDKPNARPDDVINEVFDLLGDLDAPDECLEFSVVYASAKDGWATCNGDRLGDDHPKDIRELFETIVKEMPAPAVSAMDDAEDAPLQMMVTTIIYSEYVGRIAVGRVEAGTINTGERVTVIRREDGKHVNLKVHQVQAFEGLERVETEQACAGDLCAVVGLDAIDIGDTIACVENPNALESVKIDEPTLTMMFRVNDSPFGGQDGKYVTSRQVWDRLQRELQSNVALRVEVGETPEQFEVSGRGLMHLGVLVETMRREGYELSVGKPRVIFKEIEGKMHEPIEELIVDCPSECQNDVMSLVTSRRAEIISMDPKPGAGDYVHLVFSIPARGLIGLRTRMLTATQGRAIMHHTLLKYEPLRGDVPKRSAGVMVATDTGQVTPYSLDRLYDRGIFFVKPGDQIYEGQVVGEHCKDNDITVNLVINKKHSNVRAAGSDDETKVRPAREMSLEACMEYLEEDEMVEVTPNFVRMRKRMLKESDRRRESRKAKS